MLNKPFFVIFTSIILAGICLLSFETPTLGANTASVSATVTAQNVSLTVSTGTISYGTIPLGSSKSTITTDLNESQTVTNNGNVAEDFNIKGLDTGNWTLAATPGSEQYTHKFCTTSCTNPPTGFTALTTSYQTLASNIAALGTQKFDLQITTPTSTATFTQQTVQVSIQAVAH